MMRKSLPALTGIRGVAALWVVFYHLQDPAEHQPRLAYLSRVALFREGFRGVDLFFVLSGFILMYVHQDEFHAWDWGTARRFMAARIRRVYPLNAAVMLLIVLAWWAVPAARPPVIPSAAAFVQSLTLSQRWLVPDLGAINGPAWSLSAEMAGYAAFPLLAVGLAATAGRRAPGVIAAALLCGLVAASFPLHFANDNVTGRLGLLRMLPAFTAGAALAVCFSRGLRGGRGVLATVSAVAAVVVCSWPPLAWLAVLPVAVLPVAGLILGLASEAGPVHRLVASRPVVWLGEISFSLYLTHLTVLAIVVKLFGAGTAGAWASGLYTAALLMAVVAVAAATYYGIERPVARALRPRAGVGGTRGAPARA